MSLCHISTFKHSMCRNCYELPLHTQGTIDKNDILRGHVIADPMTSDSRQNLLAVDSICLPSILHDQKTIPYVSGNILLQ